MVKFTDLRKIFSTGNFNDNIELASKLPSISISAIGGFPISEDNGEFYWLNNKLSEDFLKYSITESLGQSGILTFANKSNLSNYELGKKCLSLGHNWGFNWITISILFVGYNEDVEKSLLRNNTFYQSWIANNNIPIYVMNGSLKDFKKFISNKDDKSFDINTRKAMSDIDNMLNFLWKVENKHQYYPTPEWLSDYMCSLVTSEGKILEPSAGTGSLITSLRKRITTTVDCFEIDESNRKKLIEVDGVNLIGYDFLLAESTPIYDSIIASPPFSKNSDVIHIKKMFEFLKVGGKIITTASGSNTSILDDYLKSIETVSSVQKILLHKNCFGEKSSNTNSLLLIIKRLS